jgi:ComF family protein
MASNGSGAALKSSPLRAWYDGLLAVVFAPDCVGCARPLDAPSRGPACPACWSSIVPLAPDTQHLPPGVRPLIAKIASAGAYEGALREIVHALKYDGRRSLAAPLAALMRDRGREALHGADIAVPVPLHPARLRTRGFNQAADLAAHVGLPVVPALRRSRATRDQVTLALDERRRNVTGAFAPTRHADRVSGRIVLLVDDVATTGATLAACAQALLVGGATEVRALTAARALRERP